jgi:hypothetical protein
MIPFYEAYSPLEIALEAFADVIWCIGWVIGFGLTLWQYFTEPMPDTFAMFPDLDCEHDTWGYDAMRDFRLSSTVTIA